MPIFLKDMRIVGTGAKGQIGIKAEGGDIIAENVTFDNIERPWDLSSVRSADIRGTRIKNDPKVAAQIKNEAEVAAKRSSRMGWIKPNGPPLPAFCPQCKAIFPSKNYNFGGAFFNAWGNEETCPKCGNEHASLSEGTFNLSKNVVEILTAPDMTYAMLQAIADIADDVLKSEAVDAESTISRFELISPRVAEFLRKARTVGATAFFYAVSVAGIGSFILAYEQTELAREQTEIARRQLADQTQTKILEMLRSIETTLQGMSQHTDSDHDKLGATSTAAHQTQPSSVKVGPHNQKTWGPR